MEKFKDLLNGALSHRPFFIWKIIPSPKLVAMLWSFPGWQ